MRVLFIALAILWFAGVLVFVMGSSATPDEGQYRYPPQYPSQSIEGQDYYLDEYGEWRMEQEAEGYYYDFGPP